MQPGIAELLQDIGGVVNAIITWLLVVFGWLIVSDQGRHQEIVKANHQRFDSLRALLDEVERDAISLHSGEFNEAAARKVQRLLKKLTIDCKLLSECGAMDDGWRKRVIDLRQAVTLRNFDRSVFRAQPGSSNIIAGIEKAKDDFEVFIVGCVRDGLNGQRSLRESMKSCLRVS